jgi:hypothetical protein
MAGPTENPLMVWVSKDQRSSDGSTWARTFMHGVGIGVFW